MDPVALLECHCELECVDGVEAEPLHEERLLGRDLGRAQVLERERLDDQLLQLLLKRF